MKLCVCRSCSENGKITSELDKIAGQVEKQNPQLAAKIDEISDILDGVVKPEIKWDLRPLDGFYGNVRVLGNRIKKKMGRKKHQPRKVKAAPHIELPLRKILWERSQCSGTQRAAAQR